jgi:hypothetical protein
MPGATLDIEEAFLAFNVKNRAGFPFRLSIDEAASTSTSGGVIRLDDASHVTVAASPSASTASYSEGQHQLALGAVLSGMPSRVGFRLSATINPDGYDDGDVKNFITRDSKIEVDSVEARIPLKFRASGLALTDTLDFDLSTVTLKEMKLAMKVTNLMPVNVTLQAFLMDSTEVLSGDSTLFQSPVTIEASAVNNEPKEIPITTINRLKDAKRLKVEITVDTPPDTGSAYVHITKENYIHIQIGAAMRINIDELN